MMLMLISISPALVLLLDQMLVDLLQKSLPHLRMERIKIMMVKIRLPLIVALPPILTSLRIISS